MKYENEFYKNLIKPKFLPPKIVFKIVWPILYILMFISLLILIFTKTDKSKISSIIVFIIQISLNFLWPFIFFSDKKNSEKRRIFFAFIIAIFLSISVFLMLKMFFEINPISSYLNIPYFLWTIFACTLMFSIFIKNKKQK